MNKVIDIGATSGGKIVLAIIVLIVGLLLIKMITKGVNRHVEKSKMDPTVKLIVTKLVKILLYVVLVVGLIEILGVPMTSVAALIASGGLAVGLGFQGALANLAGGFLILIFKPFKVGDYINAADAEGIAIPATDYVHAILFQRGPQVFCRFHFSVRTRRAAFHEVRCQERDVVFVGGNPLAVFPVVVGTAGANLGKNARRHQQTGQQGP